MHRRTFLKAGCLACSGALSASLLSGCASSFYVASATLDKNRLVVKKDQFQAMKKGQTITRLFVVVNHERIEFPIALYRAGESEYTALYLQCTHQNCELRPNEQVMVCPCHGSEFDRQGKVLEGPAERSLKRFPVETDAENIYITLTK